MPRHKRCRRICRLPCYSRFSAEESNGAGDPVVIGLDEYEVLRLVAYEGLTHEACAQRMDISRTTVTEMFESVCHKLASALVLGTSFCIQGGSYRLCMGEMRGSCGADCHFPKQKNTNHRPNGGIRTMKIAVTHSNGDIFPHFGHSEQFKVYEVENGSVFKSEVVETNGQGHGALAAFLQGIGVDTVICGGIGAGAKEMLARCGITLYGGVSGSCDEAVAQLIAGSLQYQPDIVCEHKHEHEDHGECASHHCEDHACGR